MIMHGVASLILAGFAAYFVTKQDYWWCAFAVIFCGGNAWFFVQNVLDALCRRRLNKIYKDHINCLNATVVVDGDGKVVPPDGLTQCPRCGDVGQWPSNWPQPVDPHECPMCGFISNQ